MGQALIRKLDDDLLDDYREAAKANQRSLEAELREALQRARPLSARKRKAVLERLAALRAAIGETPQTPSEILLREFRDNGD
jgi:plasmid stability protein